MGNRILAFFAVLFALLALGASIVIPYLVLHWASDLAELRVPLLALSGFLGVFACVALLVLAFKAMGLTVNNQALGMPEGSVRALIAIFLIVTLGMSALFLLGPSKPGQGTPAVDQKTDQKNGSGQESTTQDKGSSKTQQPQGSEIPLGTGTVSAIAGPPTRTVVQLAAFRTVAANPNAVKPQTTGGAAGSTDKTNKTSGADDQTSARKNDQETQPTTTGSQQASGDLAKQFLTLVGGLVTTVVGFYFGSQTANSAAAKGANAAAAAATQATAETIRAMKQ